VEVDDPITGPDAAAVAQRDLAATVPPDLDAEDAAGAERPDAPAPAVDPLDEREDRVEDRGRRGRPTPPL